MPAYNEEACIDKVVSQWYAEFDRLFGKNFKFVIVNDGSKDRTGAILDGMKAKYPQLDVVHQVNQGHGAALRNGYERALAHGAEYVFHVDSDDQFRAQDFAQVWAKHSTADFVLGRRENRQDPTHRLWITRVLRGLLWMLFGQRIPDSNSPFRLIRGPFLKQMLMLVPEDVFAPNVFLSLLASAAKRADFSVSVRHEERKTGTVSIVRWKLIKVCMKCVRQLLSFRLGFERLVVSLQHEWQPPRAVQGAAEGVRPSAVAGGTKDRFGR